MTEDNSNGAAGVVCVLGAGNIGTGWCIRFLEAGSIVTVFDENPSVVEICAENVAKALARRHAQKGPEVYSALMGRLRAKASLAEACEGALWVQETITEDLQAKQSLLAAVEEAVGPHTVLASSTSGLTATALQESLEHPQRLLVAHPLNPPHIIPVVELSAGAKTAGAVMDTARRFLGGVCQMRPIVVNSDIPGLVVNRIAAAVYREVVDLVLSGAVNIEDVDAAISLGPAAGWLAAGPHLTYHLAGNSQGIAGFLGDLLPTFSHLWSNLSGRTGMSAAELSRLEDAVESAYGSVPEMAGRQRNELVEALLWVKRQPPKA